MHDLEQWENRDGTVTGVLYLSDDVALIYQWTSHDEGKGNTTKALKELNETGRSVQAIGIGMSPEDSSWQYWVHMVRKGLVDKLYDDDGIEVNL